MDDEHGVELETDRARLDAAHASEEHRGEELVVTGARVDLVRDLVEQGLARRVLDQPDERLDIGGDGNNGGQVRRRGSAGGREMVEKREVRQAGKNTGLHGPAHESPSRGREHARSPGRTG